ncbi:Arginine--tRNA ligase, cytoplasmic [Cytospora mali]|uniref:arginine--tRNA ligase n=1 Tax=Cytospora mali TaxID=578113 RepID=A0A194W8Z2_CYTMA|nr:Arginine--tRNA ligase, cytoplasmic [Valsa mali]
MQFETRTLARLLLPFIRDRRSSYGVEKSLDLREPKDPLSGRKRVVIEYSSPNIGTKFLGKHLRSTVIGSHLTRLYKGSGWEVHTINYLGDWGKTIALVGVAWEELGLGDEERFSQDPIGHLVEVYDKVDEQFAPEEKHKKEVRDKKLKGEDKDNKEDAATIESQGLFAKRNEFFRRMEDGDPKAVKLVKRFRDVSIEHYKTQYSRLGVTFDEYSGESQVSTETMSEVEEILKSKGILEEQDGSWMIDMKKHGAKGGAAIIRDRTGCSTYLLRDLAAVLERHRKHSFDTMLYVVATDNDLHLQRVIRVLDMMDMAGLASKLHHVSFSKNSHMPGETLEGIVTTFEQIVGQSLSEDEEKSGVLLNPATDMTTLSLACLQVDGLAIRRATDHTLDIEKMTAITPGIGLEPLFALNKIKTLIAEYDIPEASALSDDDLSSIGDESFTDLLRLLAQFPDITASAYKSLESSILVSYLMSIAYQVAATWDELEEDDGASPAQVAVLDACRQVLENGMRLLGIGRFSGS